MRNPNRPPFKTMAATGKSVWHHHTPLSFFRLVLVSNNDNAVLLALLSQNLPQKQSMQYKNNVAPVGSEIGSSPGSVPTDCFFGKATAHIPRLLLGTSCPKINRSAPSLLHSCHRTPPVSRKATATSLCHEGMTSDYDSQVCSVVSDLNLQLRRFICPAGGQ